MLSDLDPILAVQSGGGGVLGQRRRWVNYVSFILTPASIDEVLTNTIDATKEIDFGTITTTVLRVFILLHFFRKTYHC